MLFVLCIMGHDIRGKKKVIEHKMYVFFLYNYCLKHFSFYEELSEILSKFYMSLHVKYPLLSSYFNYPRVFSTDFREMFK